MVARTTYNVKIAQKVSDKIEEYRKKKEEEEQQPVSKTDIINILVKKGLEKVNNEK